MLFYFGTKYENRPELGDVVRLQNQTQDVVACEETGVLMLNIDADQLTTGDLAFIKSLGLTISNPDTERPVALGVDYTEGSYGHAIHNYLTSDEEEEEDDDDDSNLFGAILGLGLGAATGGFSKPFGGFGGGRSGGAGATGSW